MVTVGQIYNHIKDLADENLAESWDNVGLLLGEKSQKVQKILTCLDVTTEVVEEAKRKKVDLIISHHPFIFKAIKKIDYSDFKGKIIRELVKNDISVIAAHTNLDSAKFGLNNYMAKILELKDTRVLFPGKVSEDTGLGSFGYLNKEMTLKELAEYIKYKFDLNFVKTVKSNNESVKSVAILGGSGESFLYSLPNVDVYLTGDVGYHTAVDAIEIKQNLIDIGHVAEKVSKRLLRNYLEGLEIASYYEVFESTSEKNPFEIL